jgi:lipoyl(octanoyl) transferase
MTTAADIEVVHAGLTRYADGLAMQAEAATTVRGGLKKGIIITIRHQPVITLGRRTDDSEVLVTGARLAELGIDLHRVDRGGGATYHYPQQAVLYPILNLPALKLDVPRLLKISGNAVIDVLRGRGVCGHWHEDRPGVYMDDGAKIASVGYHLSKGLTTHGIAINTGVGWDGFRLIDPCKVKNQPVTSVEDLTGTAPDPDEFANAVAERMIDLMILR